MIQMTAADRQAIYEARVAENQERMDELTAIINEIYAKIADVL